MGVRGVALVMVLWLVVLLSVLAGTFAMASRTENLLARNLHETARARLAAEAGLHRAVFELANPDAEMRWVGDGQLYVFDFADAEVEVSIVDESGKIDLNSTGPDVLGGLLDSVGVTEEARDALVGAIMDWRDADDLLNMNGAEDPEYAAAGLDYGARDGPFTSVEELQQVLGMTWELYSKIERALTVYSGRPGVNAAVAPAEALMALPGMTPDTCQQFMEDRAAAAVDGGPQPILPEGIEGMVAGGAGRAYSVRARARLDNDATAELEVVVRLVRQGTHRAFTVLRWSEEPSNQESMETQCPGQGEPAADGFA